jgi:hypothetical protein
LLARVVRDLDTPRTWIGLLRRQHTFLLARLWLRVEHEKTTRQLIRDAEAKGI